MTVPDPGEVRPTGIRRYPWVRPALFHLITLAIAVALSLSLQIALVRPTAQPTPTNIPSPTITPIPPPTLTPTIITPPLAEGITRQELLDLRAENIRLWATIYLMRSISQIADAETSLRANDMSSVAQTLVAVDESLAQAFDRSGDAVKDPIRELRRETEAMREDLYLRPENMDLRLARLRQTILALIEERR